jgi:hypothetical protein
VTGRAAAACACSPTPAGDVDVDPVFRLTSLARGF